MHFTDRHLMNRTVTLHDAEGVSEGYIVGLFEGRNWTPMSVVLFYGGALEGRCYPVPLADLFFPKEENGEKKQ